MAVVKVLGTTMTSTERGSGRPVLFLHGNPTSSYLWRHVLDRLPEDIGRLVAIDLVGMGASGKPALDYTLADHLAHVEGYADAQGLDDLVLVGHDWGVALSLALLHRRPDLVRAVALMEGHLHPLTGWDALDEGGRTLFRTLRGPDGERQVLEENFLVETLLPAGMHRTLTEEELAVYRAPYPDPASRRPLLQWAREIPVAGEPAGTVALMAQAWEHATTSAVPKLLVHGTPGVVVGADLVAECRASLPALTVVDAGPSSHFLPEDRPAEVAAALAAWLPAVT